MSKQPPRKKKVSTNKPHRDDMSSTNLTAPTTNSEDEAIIKAVPFYVMALGNFTVASWLGWQLTQVGGTDIGAIWAALCFYASIILLVPSIVAALLSWGIAKSKRYGIRLLLALGVTLAPWLLFAILLFQ